MKINATQNQISPNARLWFYNIPRVLTEQEIQCFERLRADFLPSWNTHGKSNQGDVWLIEDRMIVVLGWNDFEPISGCSIDKSVGFIRQLMQDFQLDLMDRMWVYYQKDGQWQQAKIHQFWAMRKANEINDDTLILDTTIADYNHFNQLIKKLGDSWHAQMWK
jgi:hypothetical protein